MNQRDSLAASLLDAAFAAKLRTAYDVCVSKFGWGFCIVEGYRPGPTQDQDFAKGRDQQGHIVNQRQVVTYARAGQSMHQYGLAADIVPYEAGEAGELNWEVNSAQYRSMVATILQQGGIAWGGSWAAPKTDSDHFQVADLPATPTVAMQADYRSETPLPVIQRKYHAGEYSKSPIA